MVLRETLAFGATTDSHNLHVLFLSVQGRRDQNCTSFDIHHISVPDTALSGASPGPRLSGTERAKSQGQSSSHSNDSVPRQRNSALLTELPPTSENQSPNDGTEKKKRIRGDCGVCVAVDKATTDRPRDESNEYCSFSETGSDDDCHGEGATEQSNQRACHDRDFQSSMPRLMKDAAKDVPSRLSTFRHSPVLEAWPSQKRAQVATTWVKEEKDHVDPELITISQHRSTLHFACPYYRSNPERYRSCLLQNKLHTIGDVIRHLRRHHAKPPYCPMCYRPFNSFLARNKHILTRRCKIDTAGSIDGINPYQRDQLVKRDIPSLSIQTRWGCIWETVFPDSEQVGDPYLRESCEQAMSGGHGS